MTRSEADDDRQVLKEESEKLERRVARNGSGRTERDIATRVCRGARGFAAGDGHASFRLQLLGGLVLHQGKIAEMKTGEGKTLVATLPLYLNALLGRGAHS